MNTFIECKDSLGEPCLVDAYCIQAVEQYKDDNTEFCILYLNNRRAMDVQENFEELKKKIFDIYSQY